MWGFTRQTIDGTAGAASETTVGPPAGTAASDRDDLAALGLLPAARADRAGHFFTRDVLPAETPRWTAGHPDTGHPPVL
jgi:hypothetical protein